MAFAGDASIAYPLFVQAATTINNHFKDRSGATDFRHLTSRIEQVLNSLFHSWDLPKPEKAESVSDTLIFFGGWSWQSSKFVVGFFKYEIGRGEFNYHRLTERLPSPYAEHERSLVVLGDHKPEFREELFEVLKERHGLLQKQQNLVSLNYEPLEALARLLMRGDKKLTYVGGKPQILKVYPFGNDLPFAFHDETGVYLMGRKLLGWEKTSFPVLKQNKNGFSVFHPLGEIPPASQISDKFS